MSKRVDSISLINSVPFSRARTVAMRVLTAPELAGRVFLEGGLVPWVVSGRDSGRMHGDVDLSVRLTDMPAVRAWLMAEGLYDATLDSLRLPCNAGFGDFGVHAVADEVLVSFCPFFFTADGALHQRNAALEVIDGFEALLKATVAEIAEGDFVEGRALPDGARIGCATLEGVRAAKAASRRRKDTHDIVEIDRIGFDAGRYARIAEAFEAMDIVCVAHRE